MPRGARPLAHQFRADLPLLAAVHVPRPFAGDVGAAKRSAARGGRDARSARRAGAQVRARPAVGQALTALGAVAPAGCPEGQRDQTALLERVDRPRNGCQKHGGDAQQLPHGVRAGEEAHDSSDAPHQDEHPRSPCQAGHRRGLLERSGWRRATARDRSWRGLQGPPRGGHDAAFQGRVRPAAEGRGAEDLAPHSQNHALPRPDVAEGPLRPGRGSNQKLHRCDRQGLQHSLLHQVVFPTRHLLAEEYAGIARAEGDDLQVRHPPAGMGGRDGDPWRGHVHPAGRHRQRARGAPGGGGVEANRPRSPAPLSSPQPVQRRPPPRQGDCLQACARSLAGRAGAAPAQGHRG
mmetsp:Transcript_61149/g.177306  ORF Transcript_61149/g.177306 Transcript_61149/m.177306 type:complete len:349 (-) Transcript_61149:240-1286(-)